MNATTPSLVKLTREQSEIIFGKLFKDTGIEPSTRSLGHGEQRLILNVSVKTMASLQMQILLESWLNKNLPLNVANAILDGAFASINGHYVIGTNLLPCDGLTAFKVHYDNGESQVTNMAEGTTYGEAYSYYVGKSFTYERPNGEEYHLKCVGITQLG